MSKKFPAMKSTKFILCEDVREEARYKFSLLGVYADDSITILRPELPPNTPGLAVLQSLALVAIFRGLEGTFSAKLKLLSPDKKTLIDAPLGSVDVPKLGSATLVWKIQGFLVPDFGRYQVELSLDDRIYSFEFQIIDGAAKSTEQAA